MGLYFDIEWCGCHIGKDPYEKSAIMKNIIYVKLDELELGSHDIDPN